MEIFFTCFPNGEHSISQRFGLCFEFVLSEVFPLWITQPWLHISFLILKERLVSNARTLETVQDFLIKLGIKPLMYKEAYTWWHKIGGLEKTVAAFYLAAWCLYSANLPSLNTLKSCKTKTNPKFGDTYFIFANLRI